MIVCKFGGSSLADAQRIKRACAIMLDDPERRVMVVSAPGIRSDVVPDRKITDLLIELVRQREAQADGREYRDAVAERMTDICRGLGLPEQLAEELTGELDLAASRVDAKEPASRAEVLAFGERSVARLIASYLNSTGQPARFVDPREAGLLLTHQNGVTEILPETYDNLAPLVLEKALIIFPGFYGARRDGRTITFSRGGSDITGSILAAALDARLYENWTDRDSIQAVNPDLIHDAVSLDEISYREIRELAYIGFSIIHPEALEPVIRKRIPIRICNSNDPAAQGTRIVSERTHIGRIVTGIAASDRFVTINLRRVLINQEMGILGKILNIFTELGINVHHVPTGIDSVSIVVKEEYFSLEQELVLRHRLNQELAFEQITVVRGLAIVMLVGEGIRDTIGVMARAATALAQEQISVEMVMLDYFEISMLFMMRSYEMVRAVSALYREFFQD